MVPFIRFWRKSADPEVADDKCQTTKLNPINSKRQGFVYGIYITYHKRHHVYQIVLKRLSYFYE